MRLEVKKWGNGIAVRLPRESPQYGRLEPGMHVDVDLRPVGPDEDWEPYTFEGGPDDLSVNHDRYVWEHLKEKFSPGHQE